MNFFKIFKNFETCADPVKTEETIYYNLQKYNGLNDYIYIAFPLVESINYYGVDHTQTLINSINNIFKNKKIFFVCQHILVNKLNFYNHIVFTPHATSKDNFYAIPHYSVNYFCGENDFNDRPIKFGFRGSVGTHRIRAELFSLSNLLSCCEIKHTGIWHFEQSKEEIENNKKSYIESLSKTKFALCPRGTGPSTIRLWEAIGSGCIPIVISDDLKMPLSNIIDWEKYIIMYKDEHIDNNFFEKIEKFEKENDLRRVSNDLKNIYDQYFSNDKLHMSIIEVLRNIV